jgi:hypothetical protein
MSQLGLSKFYIHVVTIHKNINFLPLSTTFLHLVKKKAFSL